MTKKQIKTLIGNAESELEKCWAIFVKLRGAKPSKDLLKELIDFQPRLAKVLFHLETAYVNLRAKERELRAKVNKQSQQYVTRRLKVLNGYRLIIDQTVDIGKILGDSFAWIFCGNDKQLLKEHAKHDTVTRIPTGAGGIGEIAFIENAPIFNNLLVVYHGITTFLRLGDISLVDVNTFKVVAIGELKSHKIDETNVHVLVNLIGPKLTADIIPKVHKPEEQPYVIPELKPEQLQRLNRQIESITKSFKPDAVPSIGSGKRLSSELHMEKLGELYQVANSRKFKSIKIDRGLLLLGLKLNTRSLWNVFTGKSLSR